MVPSEYYLSLEGESDAGHHFPSWMFPDTYIIFNRGYFCKSLGVARANASFLFMALFKPAPKWWNQHKGISAHRSLILFPAYVIACSIVILPEQ